MNYVSSFKTSSKSKTRKLKMNSRLLRKNLTWIRNLLTSLWVLVLNFKVSVE